MKIYRCRLFTAEEIQFLRVNCPGRSTFELTELFNSAFDTDRTRKQIKTALDWRGIVSGVSGRFKKGNVPWTKGTKGFVKPNSGNFKKGHVPKNLRSIGSERICPKDGYVLTKVDITNPHTGYRGHWIHKHVHIWEQEHGPVPKGKVLMFRDGDKYNIKIDNLMLIKRVELFRLNKHRYKNAPAELKPSILALAKVEVKTFSVEKILRKNR